MGSRKAFKSSPNLHACIFNKDPNLPHVKKLVQLGFLDFCQEEVSSLREQNTLFPTFRMKSYNLNLWWYHLVPTLHTNQNSLAETVYVSSDLYGRQLCLCPSIRTPVPESNSCP